MEGVRSRVLQQGTIIILSRHLCSSSINLFAHIFAYPAMFDDCLVLLCKCNSLQFWTSLKSVVLKIYY